MPNLTTAENDLLARLTSKNVLTIGKKAMQEVADFIYRLMNVADEATKEHETTKIQLKEQRFQNSVMACAAFGLKTKEEIETKVGLSDDFRARCLELRQNYDDALAYRALSATNDTQGSYETEPSFAPEDEAAR